MVGCYSGGMKTESSSTDATRRARRAPAADERKRDAERSRAAILEAAVEEFARVGYAGARVAAIAARAGVNKQLISYYFGGKEGLYQAVSALWHSSDISLDQGTRSVPDLIAHYVRAVAEQGDFARLLAWQGLTPTPGDEQRDTRMAESVAWFRRRQEAGELAPDLDPAYVLLALFAAAFAGAALPQMVSSITGLDPTSEEFVNRYADQLARIARHLAAEDSAAAERSA